MGLVPSLYKPRTRIYDGQRTHEDDLERERTSSSALGSFSAKRIVIFRMGMKTEAWITCTSQSNRSTHGHHIPYPLVV